MLFKLAARNLIRNVRRTVMTLAGISISLGILVFSQGLMIGIANQSKRNLVDYQTAHFKISLPGYDENKGVTPLDYLWQDFSGVISTVTKEKEITGVATRLKFPARLNDGTYELPCQGIGINLTGSDQDVFLLKETITEGRYLLPEDDGLILGDGLAKIFQVGVGENITVVTRSRFYAFEALDLKVVGIIKTGNPKIDENEFYLPLPLAQSLLEAPDQINEIALRVKPAYEKNLTLIEGRIKGRLRDQGIISEVFNWQHLAADFIKFHAFKKNGNVIFLGLLVIIAAVGITNTMVMVTFERTKEIGAMMAFGMRRRYLLSAFLWEGLLLGGSGSLLGCFWGGAGYQIF